MAAMVVAGMGGSGDQTTGRGHSGGTNEDRAKDGSHEPAENDSESEEGASMQYWIKRKIVKRLKAQNHFRCWILSS